MRIKANVAASILDPYLELEHNGKVLQFLLSVSVFQRRSFQEEYDVFEQLNSYWSYLPVASQDRIFELYEEVYSVFYSSFGGDNIFEELSAKSNELLNFHNIEDITEWIKYKSNILISDALPKDYKYDIDTNVTREKTYTKNDYRELVALSISLRCMMPIWSEYVNMTKNQRGVKFKEFYAFQLMANSRVMHSPTMSKLYAYIDNNVSEDKNNPYNILNCISSEDFVYWLLSLVCVRKLSIIDIRGIGNSDTMIRYLYNFIIQKATNEDNNFENKIKVVKADESNSEKESKISNLEKNKNNSNISPEDIVLLEYSLKDIYVAVQKITLQVTKEELDSCLNTSSILLSKKLTEVQMVIMSWVFKPVISPRGILYLPKQTVVQTLGAVEAILTKMGHTYLAVLITSFSLTSKDEIITSPMVSRQHIPENLIKEIEEIYPYTRKVGSKQNAKSVNLALKCIDSIADELSAQTWRATAEISKIQSISNNPGRNILIPKDIKILLAKLMIDLGKKEWI